jgi:hypothetical protein
VASPAVANAIRSFLEGNFTLAPLLFENEGESSADTWVMVEYNSTSFTQESIGAGSVAANRWDEEGSFFCHVFTRRGIGTTDARAVSYGIADLFRGVTLLNDAIEIRDIIIGQGGPDEEGNFYIISVNVGWRMIDSRR